MLLFDNAPLCPSVKSWPSFAVVIDPIGRKRPSLLPCSQSSNPCSSMQFQSPAFFILLLISPSTGYSFNASSPFISPPFIFFSSSSSSSSTEKKVDRTHPRKPHSLQHAPVLLRRHRIIRIPQHTADRAWLRLSSWRAAGPCCGGGGARGGGCWGGGGSAFGWHF